MKVVNLSVEGMGARAFGIRRLVGLMGWDFVVCSK